MMGTLQTGKVFVLSTLAGLLAGGVLVGINLGLVQRYNTALADIELENLLAAGEFDEQEFDIQMRSIYFSQLYGSTIIGLAAGALVGGTFIAAKIRIMSPLRAALLIAGISWFVLYVIPTVKYPPSPTAMFDPEVAGTYQKILAGDTAVSGGSALGISFCFWKRKRRKKGVWAGALHLVFFSGAFIACP